MDAHFYENEKRLQRFALLHGLTSITVRFEGSGDSGQIDDITITGNDFKDDTLIPVLRPRKATFCKDRGVWVETVITDMEVPFSEFINDHVYDALEHCGVDWYNNDGGFGSWVWDPRRGVEFKVYYRVLEEELGYSERRILGTEEELDGLDDEEEVEDTEAGLRRHPGLEELRAMLGG